MFEFEFWDTFATHQYVVEDLNMLSTASLGIIASRFYSNSEANASELQENLEDMFLPYL